jgi:hypothetical protein
MGIWIRSGFNGDLDPAFNLKADPDPAFYLNADPNAGPDPGRQTNADPDPDPGQNFPSQAEFIHEKNISVLL